MPTYKQPHIPEQSKERPQDQIENLKGKETPIPGEGAIHTPEVEISVEQKTEKPVEQTEDAGFLDETINTLKSKLKSQKKKPTQIPQVRDAITVEIEKIMEQDLKEAYNELTPIQKQEF